MTSVGYSHRPLLRKLGLRDGLRMAVIDPPRNYWDLLGELPEGIAVHDVSDGSGRLDFVHLFVKDRRLLSRWLKSLRRRIQPNGMIWVSWPKKASRVATNLDGNVVRALGIESGLVDTKVCAVDEIWSGLKFVIRVKDRRRA